MRFVEAVVKIPTDVSVDDSSRVLIDRTSKNGEPASDKAQDSTVGPGGDCCNPVVHAALGWVARHELCQGCAEKALQHSHQDEAVYDGARTASIDLCHDAQTQASPRDCRRRGQANQREDSEVPFELLRMA